MDGDAVIGGLPEHCPACAGRLVVTRLRCAACGAEVSGAFARGRLVDLPEPHASLLEMFIRLRGNVKDMERELGLSYPTVRARLEEAFAAARPRLGTPPPPPDAAAARRAILDLLEQGQITAADAAAQLRALQRSQSRVRRTP